MKKHIESFIESKEKQETKPAMVSGFIPNMVVGFIIPKEFEIGTIYNKEPLDKNSLLGLALMGWGLVHAGCMPPNFANVMTEISAELGFIATPENTMQKAKEMREQSDSL